MRVECVRWLRLLFINSEAMSLTMSPGRRRPGGRAAVSAGLVTALTAHPAALALWAQVGVSLLLL